MGVHKLDIEFEDDEEIKAREEAERKKSEVVSNIDLEFGEDDSTSSEKAKVSNPSIDEDAAKKAVKAARAKKQAAAEAQQAQARPQSKPEPQAEQQPQSREVESSPSEAKPQQTSPAPAPELSAQPALQNSGAAPPGNIQYQQIPTQQVFIGPDYKLGDELKKVAASNQVLAVEIEARVKVEVTQKISEMIAKNHADKKLLEHKVGKILSQINAKAPALKNELMMIKKLLKEHCALGDEEEAGKGSAQPAQAKPSDAEARARAQRQAQLNKKKAA